MSSDVRKPSLAVFHNLPSGGGVKVAGEFLSQLHNSFSISVHTIQGSFPLNVPSDCAMREWSFPGGGRISGLRRLAALPFLMGRLKKLDELCRNIARTINGEAEAVLVHNSMYIAAPPLLRYLKVPSVYYCYEYPRHIYEPDIVRRSRNSLQHHLLAPLRRLERRMDFQAARSAGKVLTLSSWMQSRIGEIYGLNAAVIRPGVDRDIFHPGNGTDRKDEVLSVGALWPYKGHDDVIRAIRLLPDSIRPSLTIVADREYPKYGRELARLAAESNVELNIRMRVPLEELVSLYRSCRIVVCCQHREPYGLVPLEAMACGTPVIAVDEGGFRDNLDHGGIRVARSSRDISRAMASILTNRKLARDLGIAGMQFIETHRDPGKAGIELAGVLKQVVE